MKKILVVLLVAFIIIQFFRIDKTNPAPTPQMDFLTIKNTPESTAKLIKTSCYDCHSNESVYPWYSNIQPVGWFLVNHIKDGRKALNFSNFATYEPLQQAKKLNRAAHEVSDGGMPIESYLLIHDNAKLSDAQKKEVADYFTKIKTEIMQAHQLTDDQVNARPQNKD